MALSITEQLLDVQIEFGCSVHATGIPFMLSERDCNVIYVMSGSRLAKACLQALQLHAIAGDKSAVELQ